MTCSVTIWTKTIMANLFQPRLYNHFPIFVAKSKSPSWKSEATEWSMATFAAKPREITHLPSIPTALSNRLSWALFHAFTNQEYPLELLRPAETNLHFYWPWGLQQLLVHISHCPSPLAEHTILKEMKCWKIPPAFGPHLCKWQ